MIVDSTRRRVVNATAIAGFVAIIVSAPVVLGAAQPPATDNTKVNERGQAAQVTADQQKNDPSDVAITQAIRQAIVADKGLSSYAHNVKVITRDGKVTLRGPVRSSGEKKTVELKAAEVAGAENVINRLSVVARTSTTKKAGA